MKFKFLESYKLQKIDIIFVKGIHIQIMTENRYKAESEHFGTAKKNSSTYGKAQQNRLQISDNYQNILSSNSEIDDDSFDSKQQKRVIKIKQKSNDDYVELLKLKFQQQKIIDQNRMEENSSQNLLNINKNDVSTRLKSDAKIQITQEDSDIYEEILEEQTLYNINLLQIQKQQQPEINIEEFIIPPLQNQLKQKQREKIRKKSQKFEQQQRDRDRNMELVNDFLSGKVSVIWLFVLKFNKNIFAKIKQIYKEVIENEYELPLCENYEEAQKFLKVENCLFKVVTDLDNCIDFTVQNPCTKRIISIFIYNSQKQNGIARSFELKKKCRKIRGFYMQLSALVGMARQEIKEEAKFVKTAEGDLTQFKNRHKFPSFIVLSEDNSQITSYRLNLYGAIKLKQPKERAFYLKQFTDLVEKRYENSIKEMNNLDQYKEIDHLSPVDAKKAEQILKFYVKENFYYGMTNSILRVAQNADQFKPITIPFNETYHSIKDYYERTKKAENYQIKQFIAYRGAKLKESNALELKVGSYVELFGFISTSMKRKQAEKFLDGDSYLFEIKVKRKKIDGKYEKYDHGFVDINRYNLAAQAFSQENEVLFNALNVYKVTNLNLFDENVRTISLQYGAIFDLLEKNPKDLSAQQLAVLTNYKYCSQTLQSIEDDGDVYLLAQQHQKCKDFYQNKIENGQETANNYHKLANVHLECGELDQAYQNALKSLSKQNISLKSADQKTKRIAITQNIKNSAIFAKKEDYLHFQSGIKRALQFCTEDMWFQKSKMLKQRAIIRFKEGDIVESEKDLQESEQIIIQKRLSFEIRRNSINKLYKISSFCCCCFSNTIRTLTERKQLDLLQIQEEEIKVQEMNDEIEEHLIEIQNQKKKIAQYVGNKTKIDQSLKKAQQSLAKIKKMPSKDIFKMAKNNMLTASVMDKDNTPEFQSLMISAIKLVETKDPFHKVVGEYSKILGTEKKKIMKRKNLLNPILPKNNIQNLVGFEQISSEPLITPPKFNYEEYEDDYKRCKNAFIKAVNVVTHNKGNDDSQCYEIKNMIGELAFEYSKLKESEEVARDVIDSKYSRQFSEGAKSVLLIAKISLAKGELKSSFKESQQSLQILKNVLLKLNNEAYNKILIHNPLFIEINLHRIKLFNRQMKHDLALKQLKYIKKIAQAKLDDEDQTSFLANIYEVEAEILLSMGETEDFEESLQLAIKTREREMGSINIPNAICYANLFKYMRYLQDIQTADAYHHKATQIFSRFSPDHPHAWVILLANGISHFEKKQYQKAIQEIQNCLHIAEKKFSNSHINLIKIKFQYGKMLNDIGKYEKALETFQKLEKIVEIKIKESKMRERIEKIIDDQKIIVQQNLYNEMKSSYQKSNKNLLSTEQSALLGIKRCEQNLKEYQHLQESEEFIRLPSGR